MFKIKFRDINFVSNQKKICNRKIILLFYGIGCSSDDFKFLLRNYNHKAQLFIAELPGHNNLKFCKDDLLSYSKKIFLFIKKNNIKEISFFAHSLGGIIPIILVKNFIKNTIKIKWFINYEGNLTKYDTETLTKKTISYSKHEFVNYKFDKLIENCRNSDKKFLNFWSESLKKTSSDIFYNFSIQCVKLSESNELLSFFKIFFKRKIYLFGEKTLIKVPMYSFGSVRFKIKNTGHFSFFENKQEFGRIFDQLLLKKT